MFTWLKPEHILTAMIGVCTICGTALVTWSNGNVHTALTDAAMSRLQSDVSTIKESLPSIPLYAQRLAQLEAWQGEQKGYNGSVDGRLRIVEGTSQTNASEIAGIRSASMVRLK
jgi:hypothetical protein